MELMNLAQPLAFLSLALAASSMVSCASTPPAATKPAAPAGSIAKADWGAVDG
jgi:hypothetical protein